jgi:hypothetical protein
MSAFYSQSFKRKAGLEQAATRQSHFHPRTSENFKAVTSPTTCPPQTRVRLSSLPSEINFCSFVTTWIQLPKRNASAMQPAQTTLFCLLHYYKT